MSVETADPPPLFFARSPSPPSFSPHQSPPTFAAPPNHFATMSQQAAHPSLPAIADADTDMSMSITLPPLQGQNHDRDAGTWEAGDGEAMDTTPDGSTPEAAREGDAGVLVTSASVQTSSEEERLAFQAIVDAANGTAPPPAAGSVAIPPPPRSDRGRDDDATPPPRSRSQSPHNRNRGSQRHRDTSSSEDEDDAGSAWHEIHEDVSAPSESELKEIEARPEHSALDHEHWEAESFASFEDAEYRPGAAGRIEWTIKGYNGTKDKPNTEVIMKSDTVTIGGYDWQLKFFPRGNDSDYLSVYIDCVSLNHGSEERGNSSAGASDTDGKVPGTVVEPGKTASLSERSNLPIPLLPGQRAEKSHGVCAQVGVVLYNPSEPRVHVHRTWTHRHCEHHSDYGQTRFYGPYYEIALRQRGQRAAILRNDSLALTAYIRIVEDKTNCLGEHSDLKNNPWNSFALTGLQSLSMLNPPRGMGGSNVVSAVATWMLLRPFRQLLYSIQGLVPDPTADDGSRQPPLPFIKAFLKILYCLRSPDLATNGQNVSLHDLFEAMTWYGLDTRMDRMDVVQVMEVIRAKLQSELQRLKLLPTSALDLVLGLPKSHTESLPTYRVDAQESFQAAVLSSPYAVQGTPAIVTIEIQRQQFELSTRTWKKLTSAVKLEPEIHVNGARYVLQSFVAHDESLQSGGYRTVVRHINNGEDDWYLFQDNRILVETRNNANFRVERITERSMRQLAGTEIVGQSQSVAYLATYVRGDTEAQGDETWDVAQWIMDEVRLDREEVGQTSERNATVGEVHATATDAVPDPEVETRPDVEFELFDSSVFLRHTGPGIVDVFDPQTPRKTVLFPANAKFTDIQTLVMPHVEGVKDVRQLRLRLIGTPCSMVDNPTLVQDEYDYLREELTVAEVADRFTERRLWVHILDAKDLPPPTEDKKKNSTANAEPATPAAGSSGTTSGSSDDTGAALAEAQDAMMAGSAQQDAVMSDAPDINPWAASASTGQQPSNPVTVIELPSLRVDADAAASAIVDANTPNETLQSPPVPPPQPNGAVPHIQPVAPSKKGVTPNPDEIYFFLKVFDAEQQAFVPKGSFVESKKARVDKTVAKILGINGSSDAEDFPELFEEEDLLTLRSLRRRKTFQQEDLVSASIVLANFASKNDVDQLHARGLAATPGEYLQHSSYRRNFPELWACDKVRFDYFSSECYTGGWLAGQPHGEGTKVSFDGSTYAGSFQLGRRHGRGQLTYPNGDSYEGWFRNGDRHGQGTFTEAATGNSYEGGWQADKQFGEGVKRYKQAEYDERICRVCWVDEADAVFVDCGHVLMCLGCARRVDVCPKCRAKVKFAMKFWLD